MTNKFDLQKMKDNMKDNLSVAERFARRHTIETLTVAAILAATFSAWMHLFVGTLGWSVLCMAIGSTVGIFFPSQIDVAMKRVYSLSNQGNRRVGQMVAEGVKIGVALFLPFLYFGFLGLMAGSSYHYYSQQSQQTSYKGNKAA